ncbi:PREDICTED: upstream-binding factor 1-like protein 1 [Ceratotherium simum simum]|uniref:Upstream-binding factor 1-like protein 1 n=1 Tax=Ceratotherium simum simum TaxID=73337 RepID=A0ABM0HI61_CERSS|nr:PREDICTED: upstream-binding factor 1-like protein 1 [Ceratotherium simum simum]
MALPESQDHWCKEDIVKLLERMENNLPSNDRHTFRTTQSQMDWGKVAFKDFSGEMCKHKWLEISYNLRKCRSLKELVLEAKEDAKNLSKSKRRKKHPDFPKKPLTTYLRFFRENRAQYSQMHPKLSNQELTKLLSEEYRELPEQTKLKYSQDFQKEKQEFEEKLARFREDHPDLVQNPKKSDVPKRGPSKAQKKFQGNVKEVKSSPENCGSKKNGPALGKHHKKCRCHLFHLGGFPLSPLLAPRCSFSQAQGFLVFSGQQSHQLTLPSQARSQADLGPLRLQTLGERGADTECGKVQERGSRTALPLPPACSPPGTSGCTGPPPVFPADAQSEGAHWVLREEQEQAPEKGTRSCQSLSAGRDGGGAREPQDHAAKSHRVPAEGPRRLPLLSPGLGL